MRYTFPVHSTDGVPHPDSTIAPDIDTALASDTVPVTMPDIVPQILYQDRDVLIAVKPAGMPSQPDKTGDMDLLTFLQAARNKVDPGARTTLHLIHRLDRPVGGLMIFSKSEAADKWFASNISGRKISKIYTAVVCGKMPSSFGILTDYLAKNGKTNLSRITAPEQQNAKKAELSYEVVKTAVSENFGELSLLRITLITGRHHQIRVQLAGAGCPILGDSKYNGLLSSSRSYRRYALSLFASEITFKHPGSAETMTFRADPFTSEREAFTDFAGAENPD